MKKNTLITLAIIIVIIAFSWYVLNNKSENITEETAKCIGQKALLYTKTGCFACEKQKEKIGETYQYLSIRNFDTWDALGELGITSTPTWVINNNKYEGVQSIEKLKQLTGCK